MKRKKDSVSAVHTRREPQKHLLEKNGTWKFCDKVQKISQKFPEKYSWEILRNFLKLILFYNSLKIHTFNDQVLRIFQEFPENHSGEYLSNFLGWNFREIPRNFSKLILLLNSLLNPYINFSKIKNILT